MLSGETRHFLVPAQGAAHPVNFVRGHGFAVSGPAENDGAVTFAARDRFRGGSNEERIIDRFFAECAEILYFVSERSEKLLHFFFVAKAGVICAKSDLHFFVRSSGNVTW